MFVFCYACCCFCRQPMTVEKCHLAFVQMNWYPAGYMANFTPQDVELAPVDFKREMETYREQQAKGPLMQRVR